VFYKRARIFSQVELEYLKKHRDEPVAQLCIALSQTKNAIKNKLLELDGKKPATSKALPGNQGQRSKIGKRKDLGIFVRSGWEANFLRFMKTLPEVDHVEYEPTDFSFWPFGIKKGTICYTPDFKVVYKDGTYELIEVKGGFMKSADSVKIRRFKKYYPEEFSHLRAVPPSENSKTTLKFKELGVPIKYFYNELNKTYKKIIDLWE